MSTSRSVATLFTAAIDLSSHKSIHNITTHSIANTTQSPSDCQDQLSAKTENWFLENFQTFPAASDTDISPSTKSPPTTTIGTTTSKCSREDWIATIAAATVFQASTTIQPAAAATSNFNSRLRLILISSSNSTFIPLAIAPNLLRSTAKHTISRSKSKFPC